MIKITDKKECTGCYACANICPENCIQMITDNEGFWYPQVDMKKCTDCRLCEKVCTSINGNHVEDEPIAYACYSLDETIRLESSSGGIFTLIAEQIIDRDGVVFGSGFDSYFNLYHSYVDSKENLDKYRGSKYLQSNIGDTYKQARELLEVGRQVLFTGTPCQIGGLRSYLQRDFDNLFCVDIVCHGVPSPKVWQKYLSFRKDIEETDIRRIAFRRKDEGWKRFSVSFLFENDTEYLQNFDKDLYMMAFLKNVCLRPSCHVCNFKSVHRESDLTLADFWGIQELLPEMDDDNGTSLVFINSEKGKMLFENIKGNIVSKEVNIDKAVSYNHSAIKSAVNNPNREKFFEELDVLSFDELVRNYCSDSIYVKAKQKVKSLLCRIIE